MTFFNRKSNLIKELREQLSAAEDTNLTLQNEVQKEREEKTTMEKALQEALEANNNCRSIQEEMDQRTTRLQEELKQSQKKDKANWMRRRKCIKDMMRDMSLDHAQQVLKLRQDKEEAFNAKKIIQEELEQQHQLRKIQSEVWESSKNEMEVKMLQMKEEMAKLEKNLLLTQTNLEEQKRETQTSLDRAEISQTQLKEEMEKSKQLQEQIETIRAAFAKSEQEKIDKITQMALDHAHEPPERVEQQEQLRESQSNAWESSKKEMEEKMLQMKEEMSRLEKDLLQTQTNLEEQKRETKNTLNRAEISQTQLKEEKETNKRLQVQIETLGDAFVKLEQEKMEEKESRRKLQECLTEKEEVVLSLEAAVTKFQTDRKKMQLDFESVKEAVMKVQQSAEEEMKHHAQQVSKLKQDKEEACNATEILQKELEQQEQLRKNQSDDWESSKKEMEKKMFQMKEEMARLREDLLQTQTNLEEQNRTCRILKPRLFIRSLKRRRKNAADFKCS
ncbi:hypothetical protein WMY93_003762 [Mugilogobius chulae]|uniref:Uncharacterized protein n=1 Tax=Mugilogobius chulae TaxID=88201 RepID=A0AAW0PXL5_9GOBI